MISADPRLVLDVLGVEYLEKTNRLAIKCPFHADSDPSSALYLDTQLFHCFACNLTLDIVAFTAKFREKSWNQARLDLERELGIQIEQKEKRAAASELRVVRMKNKLEADLAQLRGNLPRKDHASLGELLDQTLMRYEREGLDDSFLDRAEKKWYIRREELQRKNARPDQTRAPAAGTDGGLEESLANVPRAGSEDSFGDLE